ncbi:MAG: nicotinate (nicotinamide) nucleotide adenylyltransferase [Clostridia bacterium]|nr:nicotinate (nicotinamide) nucleotide adenylyltransferase [Clostridia bacterium]
MRIGIFGGAFDPPHLGHERALQSFLAGAELDLCYVIPSGIPPHKKISGRAESQDRLRMAEEAFLPLSEKIRVSDLEISSDEISYSYRTLQRVRSWHGNDEFFLFVGTDQFLAFETWREFRLIFFLCTLCAMERYEEKGDLFAKKQYFEKEFGAHCLLLEEKAYIISSTEVREELEEFGFSLSLSPAVNRLIWEKGLYGAARFPEECRLRLRLAATLTPQRLIHTLAVEQECAVLCRLLGKADRKALSLAALYHDMTKEMSTEEQIRKARFCGIEFSREDLASPAVLHGITAAAIAREEGLSDEECNAIRYHTTGRKGMSDEEKILFFADYVEKNRPHLPCRQMRERFYRDLPTSSDQIRRRLDDCILDVLESTVRHLKEKQLPIHPLTLEAMEDLKRKKSMNAQEKAVRIAEILDLKKGRDTVILQVEKETVITDFFVIATATSSTHLKALCDEVEWKMQTEQDLKPAHVEGYQGGGWILMDYEDVIVHLFDDTGRKFFQLEKLWNGAVNVEFEKKED